MLETHIPRIALAPVYRIPNYQGPMLLRNLGRGVGRGIVDDDDFLNRTRLRFNRFQRLGKPSRAIVAWHNRGNRRRASRPRCLAVAALDFGSARMNVVSQRVHAGTRNLRIALQIPFAVKKGIWLPPFGATASNVMTKRVRSGHGDFRIAFEIPIAVEMRVGIAALCRAPTNIMPERVHACGGNVGITLEIPIIVEERVRIAAFRGALPDVVG